jgi:thiamine-phosphate pyrophosphorylase
VATALCHDVLEDTAITEGILAKLHPRLAQGVRWLTKPSDVKDDTSTLAFYQRMQAAPPWVRAIKACDRLHNLSELHLAADASKLAKAVPETQRCILPLLTDLPSLHSLLLDAIEQARVAQHDLSRAVAMRPGIYAIVAPINDDTVELKQRIETLCIAGVALVQLRMKAASDRQCLAALRVVVATAHRYGVPVIMNDRADLARAGGADGLHVGDDDLLPDDARMALGDGELGHSTHHTASLLAAPATLTHVALGPVFASRTKSGHADVVGIEILRTACAASTKPVVAIGGIDDETRITDCVRAGAHWVAMVSSLLPDPRNDAALRTTARRFALTAAAARLAPIALELP